MMKDEELKRLVDIYGDQSWHRLCKFMVNKTEIRCFKRWLYLKEIDQTTPQAKKMEVCDLQSSLELTPTMVQLQSKQISSCNQWTKEEDRILREKVSYYGT